VGGAVAIRARGWGWRYPSRRAWAVRGLDLDVAAGERVLVLGASGSGKSTLLAGLAGLLDPGTPGREGTGEQEGELLLDGVPARAAREQGVLRGTARTGLLLQDPQAQTVLARCGDDVAFGLENHAVPPEQIWPRVADALRGVGLRVPLGHPTSRLSGGERQRLALAGVLALRPELLLLDEPTAMLDPDGARALREQVAALLAGSGTTCVLVEHRVAEWLPLVDRVVVLEPGGGAVADGPVQEVIERHGARLAAQGVWIPGRTARPPGLAPSPDGPALLRARGLAARRGDGPVVVGDVDLDLAAGEAICLVGPNGAGKSTLALALGGLAAPAAGDLVAAPELADGAGPHPHRWRPRQLVTRIGNVFQEPQHQFVAPTVLAELTVGPRRAGRSEAAASARAEELLDRLRLDHLARANPFTLSGGEQRRLSVAGVLATRPRILVMDEPTFGQDARTWTELVELLLELLGEGVAAIVATHDEALVAALGDRVLRLGQPRRSAEAAGVG
jgi:energy-coupling factor transport system ATP-binding protein